MSLSIEEQVRAVLSGKVYELAVSNDVIKKGEPLRYSKVLSITQKDVFHYLEQHPVPGLDVDVPSYQGLSEGPKWMFENDRFVIGWRERGVFTPEETAATENEFRSIWIKYLVGSLGLPA